MRDTSNTTLHDIIKKNRKKPQECLDSLKKILEEKDFEGKLSLLSQKNTEGKTALEYLISLNNPKLLLHRRANPKDATKKNLKTKQPTPEDETTRKTLRSVFTYLLDEMIEAYTFTDRAAQSEDDDRNLLLFEEAYSTFKSNASQSKAQGTVTLFDMQITLPINTQNETTAQQIQQKIAERNEAFAKSKLTAAKTFISNCDIAQIIQNNLSEIFKLKAAQDIESVFLKLLKAHQRITSERQRAMTRLKPNNAAGIVQIPSPITPLDFTKLTNEKSFLDFIVERDLFNLLHAIVGPTNASRSAGKAGRLADVKQIASPKTTLINENRLLQRVARSEYASTYNDLLEKHIDNTDANIANIQAADITEPMDELLKSFTFSTEEINLALVERNKLFSVRPSWPQLREMTLVGIESVCPMMGARSDNPIYTFIKMLIASPLLPIGAATFAATLGLSLTIVGAAGAGLILFSAIARSVYYRKLTLDTHTAQSDLARLCRLEQDAEISIRKIQAIEMKLHQKEEMISLGETVNETPDELKEALTSEQAKLKKTLGEIDTIQTNKAYVNARSASQAADKDSHYSTPFTTAISVSAGVGMATCFSPAAATAIGLFVAASTLTGFGIIVAATLALALFGGIIMYKATKRSIGGEIKRRTEARNRVYERLVKLNTKNPTTGEPSFYERAKMAMNANADPKKSPSIEQFNTLKAEIVSITNLDKSTVQALNKKITALKNPYQAAILKKQLLDKQTALQNEINKSALATIGTFAQPPANTSRYTAITLLNP